MKKKEKRPVAKARIKEKKAKVPIRENSGGKEKKSAGRRTAASEKSTKLRVLILEDNPADAELMERQLKQDSAAIVPLRTGTRGGFVKALKEFRPDLILADYTLPKFNAMSALELARKQYPAVPFIVVTGSIGEEKAAACLRAGADDYLLKDRLARLGEAVRHAIENRRLQAEKMTAEELIEQAAKKWTTTFDAIKDGIALLAADQTVMQVNRALAGLIKKPFREIIGKKCYELIDSDRQPHPHCPFKKMLKSKKRESMELAVDDRVFEVIIDPITNNTGAITGAVHIMTDITERKQAEEALRESERKFKELAELLPQTVFETDLQGHLTFVNRRAYEIFGYDENDFRNGLQIWQMIAPGDRERAAANVSQALHGEAPIGIEYSGRRKDGTTFPFLIYSTPILTAGQPIGLRGILIDISERKRAENALKASEERFKAQYQGSPVAAFTWQKRGESFVLTECNANAERITHGRVKEFIGKDTRAMYGNRPDILEAFHQCFEKKSVASLETVSEHFIPGRQVLSTYAFIPPDLVMVDLEDVTERRQAEEKIKESEEKFRSIVENSSDQIFMLNNECKILSINKPGAELFEKSPQEMIGMSLIELFPENIATQFSENVKKVFHTGMSSLEEEKLLIQGHELYFSTSLNPVKDDNGNVRTVAGIVRNITETKLAEEQIRASLREKEVLLKEIHHRVKNNLQVISGLLTLQGAQTNDERLQGMIKESQSRIWTMALIHQTLYQSGNLADIDMADYIRSLVGNLLSSHARIAMPPTVSFNMAPLNLLIDKAIPLALIINELFTNALKHAFSDGQPGEIRISLQECRDKSRLVHTDGENAPAYELTVADDGVGLPAGFDLKNQKSLGLQLVTMLTKQLDGSLAVESDGGTSVHIIFSNNEKKEKQS